MESLSIIACRTVGFGKNHLFHSRRSSSSLTTLQRYSGSGVKSFATRRNSANKLKRDLRRDPSRIKQNTQISLDGYDGMEDQSTVEGNSVSENSEFLTKNSTPKPSRSAVLQACTVTSGSILALGLVIRLVSHLAFTEGWPVLDCTMVSFDLQTWHLELIAALVIVVSSCRYLLLKTWPDFAESSEAANQQVLSSLEPLDYMVVALLPGVSEEVLFRGALLPLFGLNLKSCMLVAAIFGILHLGSGRRASFAVWATFVGFAYGYATILSSSIIVPMASHGLNNLVGGLLWRYLPTSSEEK